jgi:hypothetical protein
MMIERQRQDGYLFHCRDLAPQGLGPELIRRAHDFHDD